MMGADFKMIGMRLYFLIEENCYRVKRHGCRR